MERHVDQELNEVRQRLLKMGGEVEGMLSDSIRALVSRDSVLARAVRERDRAVDALEKEIDGACLRILARQQPTAVDLRFLVSVMKIVNDLERIGDSTTNVAQSILVLNEKEPLKPYVDIPRMAQIAQEMVKESLDSFVEGDSARAIAVCERDEEIDAIYEQLFRELLTYMIEKPENVKRALHILLVAHNLERIADHATNVAEDVVYFLEGRDIRHPTLEQSE